MIKCTSKVHMLLRHQSLHIAVEKQQIVHAIEVDMSRSSRRRPAALNASSLAADDAETHGTQRTT